MGKIFANGLNNGDLVAALKEIRTDWNASLAKLDADSVVNVTTYVSGHAIPYISNIDYIGAGVADQADIVKRLQDAVTSINAVNAHLDADSGIAATNYVATCNVTDTINEATATTGIQDAGAFQGSIVRMLYTIKTQINAILAKLDADGLNDSDYVSARGIGFDIDVTGC